MNNRTTHQGGSLLGFVVIGVVLALVFIGGLYSLQRYSHDAEQDETKVASNESTPRDTSDNDKKDESTDKKTEQKAEQPDSTPAADDETDKTDNSSTKEEEVVAPVETPADEQTAEVLPETGPTDTIFQFVALGLLVFGASAYIRSRHATL